MRIKPTEFPLPTDVIFGGPPVGANWGRTGWVIVGMILAVGILMAFA
jgi:hypothetical protein